MSRRVALVTGGTHGIGLAIASRLYNNSNRNVAVCGRDEEKFTDALNEIGLYNSIAIRADVTNQEDINRMMGIVIAKWGRIDILVNNAGGGGRWGTTFDVTPQNTWREVYNKNAFAAMRFTQWALPYMLKNRWGRVITISSIYGKEVGGSPWFNMAKAAEISLMKSLSKNKEYVRNHITFNTVCPGHIHVDGKPDETNLEDFPMGRMGTAEEVANVVAFLCSEDASLVNGSCIAVDGGESHSF